MFIWKSESQGEERSCSLWVTPRIPATALTSFQVPRMGGRNPRTSHATTQKAVPKPEKHPYTEQLLISFLYLQFCFAGYFIPMESSITGLL